MVKIGIITGSTRDSRVGLSLFTDFQDMTKFNPAPYHEGTVQNLLDEVVSWSTALKTIRE